MYDNPVDFSRKFIFRWKTSKSHIWYRRSRDFVHFEFNIAAENNLFHYFIQLKTDVLQQIYAVFSEKKGKVPFSRAERVNPCAKMLFMCVFVRSMSIKLRTPQKNSLFCAAIVEFSKYFSTQSFIWVSFIYHVVADWLIFIHINCL